MIRGTTALLAHIGWPTHAFKAPMIYNPYFEHAGIDAVVVPMGCREEHYAAFLRAVFTLENIRGALDHDAAQGEHRGLLDARSPAVRDRRRLQCGPPRCRRPAGRRPVRRRGVRARPAPQGLRRRRRRARSSSAPAASARRSRRRWRGPASASIGLFDARADAAEALAARLRSHYPALEVRTGSQRSGGLRHRRQRDAARG